MAILDPTIKTKMLPAAWILLVFGFLLLFVLGFIFADGVLLIISLMSLFLFILSFVVGRLNMNSLEFQIEIPERVYAGKGFEVKAYLDNPKSWIDTFAVDVRVHVMHQVYIDGHAAWVPKGERVKIERRMSIPLRGAASGLKVSLYSAFPFGVFENSREEADPQSVIVYPRLITPLEVMSFGSMNEIEPHQGAQHGEAMGEPRGIRSWQPGDSAKRIHWVASARSLIRGQGLRVREYDPPGFAPLNCMVLFHSHAMQGEVYRHDRFERATSLAAGTLHYLHNRRVKMTFTADFLGWSVMECETRSQYIELLAILAQAERAIGTVQHDLQSLVDEFSSKIDQLVIVSDMDPDAWSEGLSMPKNTVVIDIRQMHFGRQSLSKSA